MVLFAQCSGREEIPEKPRQKDKADKEKFITVYVGNGDRGPSNPAPEENRDLTSYLSREDAKYLQDVEHYGGFILGDLAFPLLAKALRSRNIDALTKFFHPEFKGNLFKAGDGKTSVYSFASFTSWREQEEVIKKHNRDDFVKQLIQYRDEFATLKVCAVKAMKMSPVTHGEMEGPWKGTWKLILAGRTRDGKVAKRVVKMRCKVSGISNDTPKLREWFTSCEAWSAEHAISDRFLMRDMTSETGFAVDRLQNNWKNEAGEERPYLTGGLYLCDFNSDGRHDVLVTDVSDGLSLYRGKGNGKFTELSERAGLPKDARTVAFADLDGDGDEDLLLDNRVFRNEGGQNFRELVSGEHQLNLASGYAGYSIVDYDRDGRLDIYAVGGMPETGEVTTRWIGKNHANRNVLLRNLGNWIFEDVTEVAGVVGNGSPTFAAAWFDANGDNWPDVMTACYGTNDYYINQKDGTFQRGALPEGYGGFSMGLSISDIDNDGFGDPYVGNMYSKAGERVVANLRPGLYPPEIESLMRDFVTGNELYQNRGDGTFKRIGQSSGINDVGWAYGVGYGDLNGDGLPDAYSPVGFQSVSPNKPDG